MTDSLTHRLLAGDPRALARAITLIEADDPAGAAVVRELFARTGGACVIGITGPSGASARARTSMLVEQLAREIRRTGRTAAIIAIDPVEPADRAEPADAHADALLPADPVRVQARVPADADAADADTVNADADDTDAFIHRVASRAGRGDRGDRGGLARTISDIALLLDAAGRDVVLIGTAGAGCETIDAIRTTDVSLVVLASGTGDQEPALAPSLAVEIMTNGDIFIDVADIADIADTAEVADEAHVAGDAAPARADRATAVVESVLSRRTFEAHEQRPPVLRVETTTGKGLLELLAAIDQFRAQGADVQEARRRARAAHRLRELLVTRLLDDVEQRVLGPGGIERYAERIAGRAIDPHAAADEILARSRSAQASDAAIAASAAAATTGAPPAAAAPRVSATLDHVGIAVADLGAALAFYRDAIGLVADEPEEVPSQRVRAHFMPAGGEAALELLEATAPDSPIAKFVEKRGPGLHHITLRVDDIRAALARLKARGARLIDEEPRPGAHGALVAFVHPAAAHGVLVELKETGKA